MAKADAEQFLKYAVVMEIARGKDTDAVVELAASELGLSFTADELHDATEALEAASLAEAASLESDELDDDALDSVAGGVGMSRTVGGVRGEVSVSRTGVSTSVSTMARGEEGGLFGSRGKVERTFSWS